MKHQQFLIALGGNVPWQGSPPESTLYQAVEHIRSAGVTVESVSRFYRTPAVPAGSGPDFVNAAADFRMAGDAHQMLRILHETEAVFGRERRERWAERTLDLDLLAAGDAVLPDITGYNRWRDLTPAQQHSVSPESLVLPHPRLQDRAFVLVPLKDVAPDWRHPVLGRTVRQMLAALPQGDREAVKPL